MRRQFRKNESALRGNNDKSNYEGCDLSAMAEIAGKSGLISVVDNTFASPGLAIRRDGRYCDPLRNEISRWTFRSYRWICC